ncbi:uncharacterized protein BJX67DRAFT_379392 [Aspergillus lucknowensis]|uniref:Uncharacterized protein n=1 Tax=Aspergillus lucknowensis TaxID=176173 RepID=A0ABR4LXX6_9EURO
MPPPRGPPLTPRAATEIAANTISIPSTYARQHSSPSPGVIVGAVLGSVAGFLFILYLLYLTLTSGRRFSASTIITGTGATSTSTTQTPSEIVDVGIRPRPGRRPMMMRRPRRGRRGDEVIVEESTGESGVDDGGVVEVIEEESVVDPPPSSRSGRYRSRSGSSSSSEGGGRGKRYRRVDPLAYGGGSDFSGRS